MHDAQQGLGVSSLGITDNGNLSRLRKGVRQGLQPLTEAQQVWFFCKFDSLAGSRFRPYILGIEVPSSHLRKSMIHQRMKDCMNG